MKALPPEGVLVGESDSRAAALLSAVAEAAQKAEPLADASFRLFADCLPIGVFLNDASGSCVYTNIYWQRMTGLSAESSLGRGWASVVHPDDVQGVFERRRSLYAEGNGDYALDYRMITSRGVRWARARVARIWADSRYVGYVGVVEDVTERKEADSAFEQSRRRLQALFDNALDAIILADDRGRFVDVNPAACELFHCTRAELTALDVEAATAPEMRARVPDVWKTFIDSGSLAGEYTIITKDGSPRHVEFRAAAGILPGLHVSVMRDVTARKEAQALLERRAAQQAAVAQMGQRALSGTDIQGLADEAVKIVAQVLNVDCSAVLELQPSEHELVMRAGVGWDIRRPDGGRIDANAPSPAWHTLNCRQACVITDLAAEPRFAGAELLTHDRVVSCISVIIDGRPRPFGVLGAYNRTSRVFTEDDVHFLQSVANVLAAATDRAWSDDQLRGSREHLRRLSAEAHRALEEERSRLARELHDQLGQVLTGLKMDVSWLARRFPDTAATGQEVPEKLEAMSQLIDRTIHTVRRISTELRPAMLDRLGLLAAIEWQAAEFERQSGIRCRMVTTLTTLDIGRAASTEIFRICQEALTNVLRHSGATRVTLRIKRGRRGVIFEIKDNGKGIEPGALERSDSLGLFSMYERALLAGGECAVARSEGGGTTVRILVPMARRPALEEAKGDQ